MKYKYFPYLFLGIGCTVLNAQELDSKSSSSVFDVTASAETTPVSSLDDAADDIAIWRNPANPDQSIVVGTDKKYGLATYNLVGHLLSELELGRVNNVDVLLDWSMGQEKFPLLVATNRTHQSIDLLRLYPDGTMVLLHREPVRSLGEVYGIGFYADSSMTTVVVSDVKGRIGQWLIGQTTAGIQLKLLRRWSMGSVVEGIAGVPYHKKIYLSQERKGLWSINAHPVLEMEQTMILPTSPQLPEDFEGVDIYEEPDGAGYVVLSVQGADKYAILDRASGTLLGIFRIADGPNTDGVQETDGLDLHPGPFPGFPRGVLVVQDGDNPHGAQNFKYVDWNQVLSGLKK